MPASAVAVKKILVTFHGSKNVLAIPREEGIASLRR